MPPFQGSGRDSRVCVPGVPLRFTPGYKMPLLRSSERLRQIPVRHPNAEELVGLAPPYDHRR
jgi:hypothetical protein